MSTEVRSILAGHLELTILDERHRYVNSAIFKLDYFKKNTGIADLNRLAYTHVMTLDMDEANRFSYAGCDIADGKLRMLFRHDKLGHNIQDALSPDVLAKALNEAPNPPGEEAPKLSVAASAGIRKSWDVDAEQHRAKIVKLLDWSDLKFSPNFEDTSAKLSQAAEGGAKIRKDWEQILGPFMVEYYKSLAVSLDWNKFGKDEMLKEGLKEAVEKSEVAFRLVDKLEKSNYCETVVDGGVLYMQVRLYKTRACIGSSAYAFSTRIFADNTTGQARDIRF